MKKTLLSLLFISCCFVFLSANGCSAQRIKSKSKPKYENYYNTKYAEQIGGKTKGVKLYYEYYDGDKLVKKPVIPDIVTDTQIIEAGIDNKRGSLDSVQQVLFFSSLTGKKPVVVIYDTDGVKGPYEFRIEQACEEAGVEYRSVSIKSLE